MLSRSSLQWVLVVMTALVLLGSACGPKSINEILADPSRYSQKDVKVKGRVAESYSVAGRGAYQIEDETGVLWIVSDRGVPREGARVEVKGRIREGFNLGSLVTLPRGLSSGVVMIESSHKAKN